MADLTAKALARARGLVHGPGRIAPEQAEAIPRIMATLGGETAAVGRRGQEREAKVSNIKAL